MSRSLLGAFLLSATLSAPAWADGPSKGDIEVTKSLWDPAKMMQKACDGISAHYNLDDSQKTATCKMLTDRVSQFLEKHDKELWPLMAELAPYQFIGEQPDSETAKRIANRGYHIFEDARREILRAQGDFRTLLNEEQIRIHDRDLRGLHNQLSSIDRRFSDWKMGTVGKGNPLDTVRLAGDQRLLPSSASTPNTRLRTYEGKWDRYVKDFITRYQLDDGQKNRAQSILNDLKQQASQYTRQNKAQFDEADSTLREAQAARPADLKRITQAKQLRDLLYQPYEDWFTDLKTRLEQIPTEKQREQFAERRDTRRARARAQAAAKDKPRPVGGATTPPPPAKPPKKNASKDKPASGQSQKPQPKDPE